MGGKKTRNEQSLRDLWDNIKYASVHVMGISEKEEKGEGKIFEEIMAQKFSKFDEKH